MVRSGQETHRFTKADCIGEFTEVVVWRGYSPVVHRVDEVETEIPPGEFELRPVIGLGHCGSDKRSI